MKNFRKIIFFLILVIMAAGVSSCGRYSEPYPIKGSGFPHNYPAN